MVVKMRKWSPWPPASAASRKFQVAVKPIKLDGFREDGCSGDYEVTEKFVAIRIKWKGEPKLFQLMAPFQSRQKKEISSEKSLNKGLGFVQWDDKWLENTCCFSSVSYQNDPKLGAWEITFNVLYTENMDSKAKMTVIGRVSTNLSKIAWKMDKSSIEQKIPLSLQIDGITREASLTVLFNFVEIRDSQDSIALTRGGSVRSIEQKGLSGNVYKNVKARRRSSSQEDVSLDESDESSTFQEKNTAAQTSLSKNSSKPSPVSGDVLSSDKKEGWFSWKSRRFSFKRAKTKEDKYHEKTETCIDDEPQSDVSSSEKDVPTDPCTKSEHQDNTGSSWEDNEIISRDGRVKLRAPVFFASFDQRSHKAAGESACTALVAVISHWLHSNTKSTPDRLEFDNLILSGSSEWRKLCEDITYDDNFPNKHFDLDTILRADIRPLSISHIKSFIGFFGADRFESLKGVMSFDDIWNAINNKNDDDKFTPRIYIL